jgi:uncharacterized protein YeaO (DUF488 family)
MIKRVYETPSDGDGYRLLVDRLWPRGVSKERARLDEWCKEVAPSTELRKWFGHAPERFELFSERYREELVGREALLERLREIAASQRLTLVIGAKDPRYNHARVLRDLLEKESS